MLTGGFHDGSTVGGVGRRRNIVIFDDWETHNCSETRNKLKSQELSFDLSDWPAHKGISFSSTRPVHYRLRLEDCTHVPIGERVRCHERNLKRLEMASSRNDITHLEIPYAAVCPDIVQEKVEALVSQNDREWFSFSFFNIHTMDDIYARPIDGRKLYTLASALKRFKEVHLQGCPTSQGHVLDSMLKAIPHLKDIQTLRLEGWQMDRVSATALVEALMAHQRNSITAFSLRSCRFQGEGTFQQIVDGLSVNAQQLQLLNVSYCDLSDQDIIPFVDVMRKHPNIQQLHLGGNSSKSEDTLLAIADWIQDPTCKLTNINLRALWIGFSDDGLLQRWSSLTPLYEALRKNTSISNFTLSENYLDDEDLCNLCKALSARPTDTLRHFDVTRNPFQEVGAKSLEIMLRNMKGLVSVHFENDIFPPYNYAERLKFLAQINKVEQMVQLKSPTHDKPQIWPHAFAKIQGNIDESTVSSSSIVFHLLRSTVGPYGKELSMQIATHEQ